MKKYIITVLASLAIAAPIFAYVVPPPLILPTDTDQCKNYIWQDYDGTFNNQGDCVSFVVTDGGNQPDGPAVQ